MKQQTAVELLLSKIPDAAEIKAFISDNNADEKMLDEWLWERIHKNVDYKQIEKEQIIDAHYQGYRNDIGTTEVSEQYYNEVYGGQGSPDTTTSPNTQNK